MEVQGGYKLQTGARAPPFRLPGVDGKDHALEDYAGKPVLVVAWWCNHCPYVQAYEDRVVAWAREVESKGVQVVAINANDPENYLEDSFDNMAKRAEEKGYAFPYLMDRSQEVAAAYGGECTPHFQVFDADRRLRYQGRFDDNRDDPAAVKERYLPDAVDALLRGEAPPKEQTWAIGCSIKWTK